MSDIKLISWNVNGIRAVYNKGMFDQVFDEEPDILCLQETKATAEQVPDELHNKEPYHIHFSSAERKGYSGVALYSKTEPNDIKTGFGIARFDQEGRVLIAEYDAFTLFNIYFPNGKASKERLAYKMDFYDAFLEYADGLTGSGKDIVVCGDVNTAHHAIDLARPKENEKTSGFLPEERAWIDKFLSHGYVDTFRIFNQEAEQYTWWDYKTRARDRNIGWRIDYFYVNQRLEEKVSSASIYNQMMGSDHCPIGITLSL